MRILVVEDEEKVASFIQKGLEQSDYTADIAGSGEEAMARIAECAYDAVILDIMLPGIDGLEVVRELRSHGEEIPVLALTARGGLQERVAGLDAGCDDYLPKPFAFDELLARLRALLRRRSSTRPLTLEYGDLSLDPFTRVLTRAGKEIPLTNKEYRLLETLMRHPDEIVPRQTIMEAVWGRELDAASNVLEVYMNFLRKKVDQGFNQKVLQTVRGVGYALRSS